ncbi:DUF692 domain-containing protein [Aquabacterium sp.]|uniref:MNIO family bufferin maturase n=1 Tax=Aquabacterium sp. TaxID=1872578 RepID=UPI002B5CA74C|nr:DUF692 domain-containing protein [Aquabacterium sp.]HSW08520.1 DUF692 domain-containing protein [Aquabacterium sp.]
MATLLSSSRCGIGLRAEHYRDFLARRPPVGLVEMHSENCFGGGRHLDVLLQVRETHAVSLHGVGLSLGSTDALSAPHLKALKALVDRVQPALVSEHFSFSSFGGIHSHDLLPLPNTREVLDHVAARVMQVQDVLGRPLLLENISAYLRWRDDEIGEPELLATLARRTGCGLLLDLNNLVVNAGNHGEDPLVWLQALPADAVQEYHLAGHVRNTVTAEDGTPVDLLIDTHSRPVGDAVWALYAGALRTIGPRPTLVEWDSELPPLQVLLDEAARADAQVAAYLAGQAAGQVATPMATPLVMSCADIRAATTEPANACTA